MEEKEESGNKELAKSPIEMEKIKSELLKEAVELSRITAGEAQSSPIGKVRSAISTELANFKREKEEADFRKERAEVFSLVRLLSSSLELTQLGSMKQYEQRVQAIERYNSREEYILPLNAFLCCINGTVMTNPVSLCTGTTCERAAIADWFESGKRTDPHTKILTLTYKLLNPPLS
ncbi:putative U-box domain-containing protein 42 isoform X1 [Cannabis sativa]|uniref:putative U-box domain-containing protein 42 isoform X1 n=1 Tax=Cannabis sativa TaxID=3483 RepID=UPI0029C9DC9A|nr:putative U-box domain-containing protein 42 isoform X1 [Cannabis sativa]XP_060966867.1 putative U-box domain-containing protein 42 isoform X1 [Cannabis sativa]